MSDFQVTGASDFLRLSKALKAAGDTDLRKELHKGLRDAAKDLIPLAREEARETLPSHGGLAARVAKAPIRVAVKTGRDPGVSLMAGRKGSGAAGAERGLIRHQVFGNQDEWVEQRVRPGWLSRTVERHRRVIVGQLEQALERVADKVVRRG